MADRRALAAYRQQLRRIGAELASADAGTAEAEALSREREALPFCLPRQAWAERLRWFGQPTERMRKAVRPTAFGMPLPALRTRTLSCGRHLRACVRAGTWCSYAPEHRVDWQAPD